VQIKMKIKSRIMKRTMAMKRLLILLSVVCVSAVQISAATSGRTPNLIVIMADDIGASELACYGNPTHRTPNLDQLARTGVKFETCFTAPVCHPTRFTVMTGSMASALAC